MIVSVSPYKIKMYNWNSIVYLLFALFAYFSSITLAEYRKLIPNCSNSCLTRGAVPTNCHCDSKCSLIYNDCCLDAPYRTFRVTTKRKHNINCVFVHGENSHFWMVDTCKSSWSGHDHVREKCTALNSVSGETNDIIGAIPVTNVVEGVTYKNYYCSMCNEETTDGLVEWQVRALCRDEHVSQEDILRNLTFVEDRQQWGVWKWDMEDQGWTFHECYLLFQAPSNVTDGVRSCVPSMVSTCPKSWQSIATRRKCKSYVDPVRWTDGPVFRNMDCAFCHNRTRDGYKCVYDLARGSNAIMLSRTMTVDLSSMGQWF